MDAYTGGALNLLNGKMGISAPKKSVPVMRLIKTHKPASHSELEDLITFHYTHKCACGIISTGTVKDFGLRLYNAQLQFWGEYKFSKTKCIQWEYDLFIVQSMKGKGVENKAINILNSELTNLLFQETAGYLDDELRIDIIIRDNDSKLIGGIQVKPESFKFMRNEVIYIQMKQNAKWPHPVWFLYYDNSFNFTNLQELVNRLIS
jgi:hypothetical protein